MNMDRRSFLLGTSAALALATVPKLVTAFEPVVLPDSTNVIGRSLFDLTAASGEPWPGPAHHAAITIGRPDHPVLQFGMGPGGCVRWAACPGDELILKRDQDMLALIDWWPPPKQGYVTFAFRDTFDDGGYMMLAQSFNFTGLEAIVCEPLPLFTERLYPVGHPKHVPCTPLTFDDDDFDDYEYFDDDEYDA